MAFLLKLMSSVITDRVTQLRQCNVGVFTADEDFKEELSPIRLKASSFGIAYSVRFAETFPKISDLPRVRFKSVFASVITEYRKKLYSFNVGLGRVTFTSLKVKLS